MSYSETMDIKRIKRVLIVVIVLLTISGCEKSSTYNFLIDNLTQRSILITSSNNELEVFLESCDMNSVVYDVERDSYFPPDLVMNNCDSLKMIFSDGRALTFYNSTEVFDTSGVWIKTLPPRIKGVNGIQNFPVPNIKNVLSEEDWKVDCNKKRKKKCKYLFEITNEYYKLAK